MENNLKFTQFAIEHAVDPAFFIREDGSFFYVNEAACRTLGYSREELLSLSIPDITPDYPRGTWADRWREMRDRRNITFEGHHRTKDGRVFPVEVTANHLEFQGIEYDCAFARDITERMRGERRRSAHHAVTRVLAEATSLSEATPPILHAICRNLGWAFGALWWIDANAHRLRCVETWQRSPDQLRTFVARTREITFAKKVGLPGQVWASNQPVWIPDVTRDSNLPRASVAAHDGLHAAFAFPIRIKEDVEGVMEFFSSQIHQPDDDLLRLVDTVGSQIGQFIERWRAEETLNIKTTQLDETVEAMTRFVETCSWKDASTLLLRSALKQTQSEYGFIGVVTDGPALRILAHEGVVWTEDETMDRKLYQQAKQTFEDAKQSYEDKGYLEFRNLENLFGRVITSGDTVLSINPATDTRAAGTLPLGHPPLRQFLGVPIYRGADVVGMIAVANGSERYSTTEQDKLKNLMHAAGVLYDSYRRSEHEAALEAERDQAEQTLRFTQFAIDHAGDAAFWMDANARFFYVNEAACRSLGYSSEELLQMSVHDIDPGYPADAWADHWAALKVRRSFTFESHQQHKDGHIFPVEITVNYMEFDGREYNCAFARNITERKQAEAKTESSLREKELLLKEIQHRVKNNLQIINSLLDLQALSIRNKQAKVVFEECQNRIKSMALLYEKLHWSADFGNVRLRDYTQNIIDHLTQFYRPNSKRVSIQLHCADVTMGLDGAIPCGLIINELVSNALKHAFPKGRSGRVTITIRPSRGSRLELIVSDDGIGLPDDLDARREQTLGLQLTRALAREQLQGRIKSKSTNGTTWTVTFAPAMAQSDT